MSFELNPNRLTPSTTFFTPPSTLTSQIVTFPPSIRAIAIDIYTTIRIFPIYGKFAIYSPVDGGDGIVYRERVVDKGSGIELHHDLLKDSTKMDFSTKQSNNGHGVPYIRYYLMSTDGLKKESDGDVGDVGDAGFANNNVNFNSNFPNFPGNIPFNRNSAHDTDINSSKCPTILFEWDSNMVFYCPPVSKISTISTFLKNSNNFQNFEHINPKKEICLTNLKDLSNSKGGHDCDENDDYSPSATNNEDFFGVRPLPFELYEVHPFENEKSENLNPQNKKNNINMNKKLNLSGNDTNFGKNLSLDENHNNTQKEQQLLENDPDLVDSHDLLAIMAEKTSFEEKKCENIDTTIEPMSPTITLSGKKRTRRGGGKDRGNDKNIPVEIGEQNVEKNVENNQNKNLSKINKHETEPEYLFPPEQIPSLSTFPNDTFFTSPSNLPKAIAMSYLLNQRRFIRLKNQIESEFEKVQKIEQNLKQNFISHKNSQHKTQNNRKITDSDYNSRSIGQNDSNPSRSMPYGSNDSNDSDDNDHLLDELNKNVIYNYYNDPKYASILSKSTTDIDSNHTVIWCQPSAHNELSPAEKRQLNLIEKNNQNNQNNYFENFYQKNGFKTEVEYSAKSHLIHQGILRFLSNDYNLKRSPSWTPSITNDYLPYHNRVLPLNALKVEKNFGKKNNNRNGQNNLNNSDKKNGENNNLINNQYHSIPPKGNVVNSFEFVLMSEIVFRFDCGNNNDKKNQNQQNLDIFSPPLNPASDNLPQLTSSANSSSYNAAAPISPLDASVLAQNELMEGENGQNSQNSQNSQNNQNDQNNGQNDSTALENRENVKKTRRRGRGRGGKVGKKKDDDEGGGDEGNDENDGHFTAKYDPLVDSTGLTGFIDNEEGGELKNDKKNDQFDQSLSLDCNGEDIIFSMKSTLFPTISFQGAYAVPILSKGKYNNDKNKKNEKNEKNEQNIEHIYIDSEQLLTPKKLFLSTNTYKDSITLPISSNQPHFPLLYFTLYKYQLDSIMSFLPTIKYKKSGQLIQHDSSQNNSQHFNQNNTQNIIQTTQHSKNALPNPPIDLPPSSSHPSTSTSQLSTQTSPLQCAFCAPSAGKIQKNPHFNPKNLPHAADSPKTCPFHVLTLLHYWFLTNMSAYLDGMVISTPKTPKNQTTLLDLATFHRFDQTNSYYNYIYSLPHDDSSPIYGPTHINSPNLGNFVVKMKNLLQKLVVSPLLFNYIRSYQLPAQPLLYTALSTLNHNRISQLPFQGEDLFSVQNLKNWKLNSGQNNQNNLNNSQNYNFSLQQNTYLTPSDVEQLPLQRKLCHIIRLSSDLTIASQNGPGSGQTLSSLHLLSQELTLFFSHFFQQKNTQPHIFTIILPILPDKYFMDWYYNFLQQLPGFVYLHLILIDFNGKTPPKDPISFENIFDQNLLNLENNLQNLQNFDKNGANLVPNSPKQFQSSPTTSTAIYDTSTSLQHDTDTSTLVDMNTLTDRAKNTQKRTPKSGFKNSLNVSKRAEKIKFFEKILSLQQMYEKKAIITLDQAIIKESNDNHDLNAVGTGGDEGESNKSDSSFFSLSDNLSEKNDEKNDEKNETLKENKNLKSLPLLLRIHGDIILDKLLILPQSSISSQNVNHVVYNVVNQSVLDKSDKIKLKIGQQNAEKNIQKKKKNNSTKNFTSHPVHNDPIIILQQALTPSYDISNLHLSQQTNYPSHFSINPNLLNNFDFCKFSPNSEKNSPNSTFFSEFSTSLLFSSHLTTLIYENVIQLYQPIYQYTNSSQRGRYVFNGGFYQDENEFNYEKNSILNNLHNLPTSPLIKTNSASSINSDGSYVLISSDLSRQNSEEYHTSVINEENKNYSGKINKINPEHQTDQHTTSPTPQQSPSTPSTPIPPSLIPTPSLSLNSSYTHLSSPNSFFGSKSLDFSQFPTSTSPPGSPLPPTPIPTHQEPLDDIYFSKDSHLRELNQLPICVPFSVQMTPFHGVLIPVRINNDTIIYLVISNRHTTQALKSIVEYYPNVLNVIEKNDEKYVQEALRKKIPINAKNVKNSYKNYNPDSTSRSTQNINSFGNNIGINSNYYIPPPYNPDDLNQPKMPYFLHLKLLSILTIFWFQFNLLAPQIDLRTHVSNMQMIETSTSPVDANFIVEIAKEYHSLEKNNKNKKQSHRNHKQAVDTVSEMYKNGPLQGFGNNTSKKFFLYYIFPELLYHFSSSFFSDIFTTIIVSHFSSLHSYYMSLNITNHIPSSVIDIQNYGDLYIDTFQENMMSESNQQNNNFDHNERNIGKKNNLNFPDASPPSPSPPTSSPHLPTPRQVILSILLPVLTNAFHSGEFSRTYTLQYNPPIFDQFLKKISENLLLSTIPTIEPHPHFCQFIQNEDINYGNDLDGFGIQSRLILRPVQFEKDSENWVVIEFLLKTSHFLNEISLQDSVELLADHIMIVPSQSCLKMALDDPLRGLVFDGDIRRGNDGFDLKHVGKIDGKNDKSDGKNDKNDEKNKKLFFNLERKIEENKHFLINEQSCSIVPKDPILSQRRLIILGNYNTLKEDSYGISYLDEFYEQKVVNSSQNLQNLLPKSNNKIKNLTKNYKKNTNLSTFPSSPNNTIPVHDLDFNSTQYTYNLSYNSPHYTKLDDVDQISSTVVSETSPIHISMPLYQNHIYTRHEWEFSYVPKRYKIHQQPLPRLDRVRQLTHCELVKGVFHDWSQTVARFGTEVSKVFASLCCTNSRQNWLNYFTEQFYEKQGKNVKNNGNFLKKNVKNVKNNSNNSNSSNSSINNNYRDAMNQINQNLSPLNPNHISEYIYGIKWYNVPYLDPWQLFLAEFSSLAPSILDFSSPRKVLTSSTNLQTQLDLLEMNYWFLFWKERLQLECDNFANNFQVWNLFKNFEKNAKNFDEKNNHQNSDQAGSNGVNINVIDSSRQVDSVAPEDDIGNVDEGTNEEQIAEEIKIAENDVENDTIGQETLQIDSNKPTVKKTRRGTRRAKHDNQTTAQNSSNNDKNLSAPKNVPNFALQKDQKTQKDSPSSSKLPSLSYSPASQTNQPHTVFSSLPAPPTGPRKAFKMTSNRDGYEHAVLSMSSYLRELYTYALANINNGSKKSFSNGDFPILRTYTPLDRNFFLTNLEFFQRKITEDEKRIRALNYLPTRIRPFESDMIFNKRGDFYSKNRSNVVNEFIPTRSIQDLDNYIVDYGDGVVKDGSSGGGGGGGGEITENFTKKPKNMQLFDSGNRSSHSTNQIYYPEENRLNALFNPVLPLTPFPKLAINIFIFFLFGFFATLRFLHLFHSILKHFDIPGAFLFDSSFSTFLAISFLFLISPKILLKTDNVIENPKVLTITLLTCAFIAWLLSTPTGIDKIIQKRAQLAEEVAAEHAQNCKNDESRHGYRVFDQGNLLEADIMISYDVPRSNGEGYGIVLGDGDNNLEKFGKKFDKNLGKNENIGEKNRIKQIEFKKNEYLSNDVGL